MSKSAMHKAHVDVSGHVWLASHNQIPVISSSKIMEFICNHPFTKKDMVQAL